MSTACESGLDGVLDVRQGLLMLPDLLLLLLLLSLVLLVPLVPDLESQHAYQQEGHVPMLTSGSKREGG